MLMIQFWIFNTQPLTLKFTTELLRSQLDKGLSGFSFHKVSDPSLWQHVHGLSDRSHVYPCGPAACDGHHYYTSFYKYCNIFIVIIVLSLNNCRLVIVYLNEYCVVYLFWYCWLYFKKQLATWSGTTTVAALASAWVTLTTVWHSFSHNRPTHRPTHQAVSRDISTVLFSCEKKRWWWWWLSNSSGDNQLVLVAHMNYIKWATAEVSIRQNSVAH